MGQYENFKQQYSQKKYEEDWGDWISKLSVFSGVDLQFGGLSTEQNALADKGLSKLRGKGGDISAVSTPFEGVPVRGQGI